MSCGDLIKRGREGREIWEQSKEKYLGRLKLEIVRDACGSRTVVRLVILQKPSKTDPSGKKLFE